MQNTKNSPTLSDLAFEEFRKIFPNVNCRVDETYMNYKLPTLQAAFRNLTRAQEIISQQKLPLTAKVHSDYQNHILHIQFNAAI